MDKKAKRTIITFSFASLLNDIGADMIKPMWPLFITTTLGGSGAFLGLLDGFGQFLSYITRFPFGYYADRWKRKPFVWSGYLCAGLSRIGYALSGTPGGALFSHILDRTGKGMRDAPRDAILAAHTPRKHRGAAFGALRGMDSLGATLGPLIAFLLLPFLDIRTLFAIAAIPSAIGAALIYFMIREHSKKGVIISPFRWKELTLDYKRVFWISGLFALSWISISFMILYATRHGIATWETPLLYLVFSLTAACMSYPVGLISDALGRKTVLLAGYTLFAVTMASFLVVSDPVLFYLLFFMYGIHYAIVESMQGAYVSDVVKDEHRASALGLFQALWGACLLPASVIAGLLWDNVAPWAPFVYSAGIATIAVIFFAYKVPEI